MKFMFYQLMYDQQYHYKMIQNDKRHINYIVISGLYYEPWLQQFFFFSWEGARTFSHKVTFKLFKNISVDHPLYPG
jgi:hypothetical protein